jgi:hypothetical protein
MTFILGRVIPDALFIATWSGSAVICSVSMPTWQARFGHGPSVASWSVERPATGLDKADIIGRMPIEHAYPLVFQLPLPLEGA